MWRAADSDRAATELSQILETIDQERARSKHFIGKATVVSTQLINPGREQFQRTLGLSSKILGHGFDILAPHRLRSENSIAPLRTEGTMKLGCPTPKLLHRFKIGPE